MNTRDLVLSALFAAIIVALGLLPPIPIGIIPVPITAQSLGVMLAGVVLGAKRGTIAVLIVVLVETGNELAAEVEIRWLAVRGDEHDPVPLPEDTRDWLYKYLT